ncbi:MAG: DUF4157 domain-containing protein [Pseudomonadota bacterium]|nr:DUF4157 domain-containing protein [Pseudomonadota bacterium]
MSTHAFVHRPKLAHTRTPNPGAATRLPGVEQRRQVNSILESADKNAPDQTALGHNASHTSEVSPNLEAQIRRTQGTGKPLPAKARDEMSLAMGADFGNVRIHTDRRAEAMNHALHARAFTHGTDIYFGRGEFDAGSGSGRHLLAHELTHVVQQAAHGERINRVPNPAPPPDPYVPGRPAHNHPAQGNWAAVQANAAVVCARETTTVTPPAPLPQVPIPVGTTERGKSECACAVMSPANVLAAARSIEMSGKPLAIAHLDHYLSGGGADYVEHSNLDDLMNTDAGARGVVAGAIGVADRGQVFIHQYNYSDENFLLAFGGIDRVDYQVDRAGGTVDVWFKDRYDFHPAGFGHTNMGVGDDPPPGRVTNCVHLAAVELKSSGAADYWMFGHATLPLSLFSSTTSPSPGTDL